MTETPRDTGPDRPGTARQPGAPLSGAPVSPPSGYGADATHTGDAANTVDGTNRKGADTPAPAGPPGPEHQPVTRAGMVWAAVASALVVLILLIAFILQNQDYVSVKFFGLEGAVSLGIALFIAAVGGGVLVAIAGAARIIQLRLAAHRQRVKLTGRR